MSIMSNFEQGSKLKLAQASNVRGKFHDGMRHFHRIGGFKVNFLAEILIKCYLVGAVF